MGDLGAVKGGGVHVQDLGAVQGHGDLAAMHLDLLEVPLADGALVAMLGAHAVVQAAVVLVGQQGMIHVRGVAYQYQARVVAVIDRTAAMLRWAPGRFAPATGQAATVSFSLVRTATTTLAITGPSGKTIRTAWSNKVLRAGRSSWTWDGRDAAKKRVAAGSYVAVLTVRTSLGTTTIMRTVVVQ